MSLVEKDREKSLGARDDVETGQKEGEDEEERHHHHHQPQQQQQQVDTNDSSSTLFQQRHNQIRFHHLAAATGLIVTYLIEIIVQILLIVVCCRTTTNLSEVTSAWWWGDWSWFLVYSFAVSSLVVTVVSLVWVCRSLDFAGRLCGRLLCYVMHSLLLGLMWRYLKLAFVYDRADVEEFVALRILQTYFQSLPLTSIHLAWLISSRQNWSSATLGIGIVLLEFLSLLTALVLSSYIKSSFSSSSSSSPSSTSPEDPHSKSKGAIVEDEEAVVMEIIVKNLTCSPLNPRNNNDDNSMSLWPQLLQKHLTTLSRALLLSSRLLVIGIIIVHLRYWTVLFTLVHFILSFSWISFSVSSSSHHHHNNNSHHSTSSSSSVSSSRHILLEEMEGVSLTKGKDFVTLVTEWSYVLFWDVTSTLSNNISWCTWILPVLLVMLENGVMILVHWYQREDQLVTIVSGSCLLLGWLLFSSLNFVKTYSSGGGVVGKCCAHHHHSSDKMTSTTMTTGVNIKDKSQQTLPVIEPTLKNHHQHPLPLPPTLNPPGEGCEGDGGGGKVKVNKVSQSDSLGWNTKKIHPAAWDLSLFSNHVKSHPSSALPNNYHNINEVLRSKAKTEAAGIGMEKFQSPTKNGRKSKTDSSPEVYTAPRISPEVLQSPLIPSSTWVPDTCCNDSNGSSNSRNTNTLRETGNPIPDLDNLDNDPDPDENDTDVDNLNFVFYFPTDSSVQQSVTSAARLQKCSDRYIKENSNSLENPRKLSTTPNNLDNCRQSGGRGSHRKVKKKSRSSSISSFSNIRRYRTSTPIEIKQASRILVNNPSYHTTPREREPTRVSDRCYCYTDYCEEHRLSDELTKDHYEGKRTKEQKQQQHQIQSQYENLIEDSYGILICESSSTGMGGGHTDGRGGDGKNHHHHSHRLPFQLHNSNNNSLGREMGGTTAMGRNRKIKVLCAKCLQNHDPLLTNCVDTGVVATPVKSQCLTKEERTSQVLLALDPSSRSPPPPHHSHHHRHYHGHHWSPLDHDHNNRLSEENKNPHNNNKKKNNSRRPSHNSSRPRQPLPISPRRMRRRSSNSLVDEDEEEEEDDDPLPSDTTDYPSETEMTCTVEGDDEQLSSNLSTATYTTWPHSTAPHSSMWTTSTMMPKSRFPKEFTSLEYVRTWLLTSQARLWQHKQIERTGSRSRLAKKVYRSNTMAAQSRRVRFVGVMTKEEALPGSLTPSQSYIAGPSGNRSGRSSLNDRRPLQLHDLQCSPPPPLPLPPPPLPSSTSLSLSLSFQPPPRRKQHPVLPHNSVPHHNDNQQQHNHSKKGGRPPHRTNCHTNINSHNNNNDSSHQQPDKFFKDVEIIL